MSQALTLDFISALYRRFGTDLKRVRESQRKFYARWVRPDWLERNVAWRGARAAARKLQLPMSSLFSLRPQLDDIEAEVTYLLVRELKPHTIVEISPSAGWSSSWLLNAARDNNKGTLYSCDIMNDSIRILPPDLTQGRRVFIQGDVRRALHRLPERIDYLFMDSDHGEEFAKWYVGNVFPKLQHGALVSVHDVFHTPDPCGHDKEGGVIIKWLAQRGSEFFTASPAKKPEHFAAINRLRQELGFDGSIHNSQANPMVLFFVEDNER